MYLALDRAKRTVKEGHTLLAVNICREELERSEQSVQPDLLNYYIDLLVKMRGKSTTVAELKNLRELYAGKEDVERKIIASEVEHLPFAVAEAELKRHFDDKTAPLKDNLN